MNVTQCGLHRAESGSPWGEAGLRRPRWSSQRGAVSAPSPDATRSLWTVEFSLLVAAQTYCPATSFREGASPKPSIPTWSKKLRALEPPFSTGKASSSLTTLSPRSVPVPQSCLSESTRGRGLGGVAAPCASSGNYCSGPLATSGFSGEAAGVRMMGLREEGR